MERFGNPLYILLPESDVDDERKLPKKIMHSNDIDILLPIHDKYFCALDFTPNWNYGRLYEEYKAVDCKWLKTEENWSWWNCIFVDFDIKDYSKKLSLDEYRKIIYKNLEYLNLHRCTFITRSWWWFHVYRVFDTDLAWTASTIDIIWIWKHLVWSLSDIWADKQVCRISRSMRYPWSFHYKTWQQIKTQMCSISEHWDLVEYDQSLAYFLTIENMRNAEKYIYQAETDIPSQRFRATVSLKEILKHLPEYSLDWFKIKYKWDETSGYRYCSKWDYAIDFTWKWRPQWSWIPFLYQHFEKDLNKIDTFLLDHFNISSSDIKSWIVYQCWDKNWLYYVDSKGSFLQTKTKDWELQDSKISWSQIIPLSRSINWDWRYAYTWNIWWKVVKLDAIIDSRDFDKKMWPYNVVCVAWWWIIKRVLDLFSMSKDIPDKERESESWFFHWWMYVWWKLIYWQESDKYDSDWRLQLEEWKHITPADLVEYLSQFRPRANVVVALCWFINLFTMNLSWNTLIRPSLFITWRTWTGKTTLMQIMKQAMWFSSRYNEMSVNMITPQPLKMMLSDWQPMYLEEFTDNVNPAVESILRNAMNWWTHRLWISAWHNITITARSSMCIVWEMRPKLESVNNRLILITLKKEEKKWWRISWEQFWWRIRKTVCSWLIQTWTWFETLVKSYQDRLFWFFPEERTKDIYSFIYAINSIFKICPEEDLLWYIKPWLNDIWLWEEVFSTQQTAETRLMSKAHLWEIRIALQSEWCFVIYWRDKNLYTDLVNELRVMWVLKKFTFWEDSCTLRFDSESHMANIVYLSYIEKLWKNLQYVWQF